MNISVLFDQIVNQLVLLFNDIWLMAILKTSVEENDIIIILWAIVVYILIAFLFYHIVKGIIIGLLRFISNPLTIIFFILIIILIIWTFIDLNNLYPNNIKTNKSEKEFSNLLPEKVEVEVLESLNYDLNSNDAKISQQLKEIEKNKQIINDQTKALSELKSN